jgi:magnesium transporter
VARRFVVDPTVILIAQEIRVATSQRYFATIAVLMIFGFLGCSEELGPERPPTTNVQGKVTIGQRPVTAGWVTINPDSGVRGNLRVARILPDGTFQADRVPVGRVIIAIEEIPTKTIPTPFGSFESWKFRTANTPVRRTIPERRDVDLPIDLVDEASQALRGVKKSRRKRTRLDRKSNGNGRASTSNGAPPEPGSPTSLPRIRIVYRDGLGQNHLEWPLEKLETALADAAGTVWIDIEDIESANNASVETMLGDVFHFHPLAIEDALKDTHVPKVDDWGKYLYIVVDTIDFDPETDELRLHELDLFLGTNYLVTYHNESTEVLERHRRNIEREPDSRLKSGPAHLLYRLLDEVVAEFLPAIEHLDNEIDDAQDEVFDVPTPQTLRKIFHVKRSALHLHRVVIPMREVMNRLARDPYVQIHTDHRIYFRDVYDHLVRIHDIIESLRDLISGALDTYLSVVSNRTNDIMKALTLVNVMFLPMSFVAGFFGMNFFGETLMFVSPGLPKAVLFGIACTIMIGTPIGMAFMARRRNWL